MQVKDILNLNEETLVKAATAHDQRLGRHGQAPKIELSATDVQNFRLGVHAMAVRVRLPLRARVCG